MDGLFVEPDIWRGGISRALVDACSAHAKGIGASYLNVLGNPHVEGFYMACGFEQYGLHKTQFGTGLLMCKAI
ncbi:MAG: GNAT family N-acetyltransferase [Rhizobiaceae bacterium]|nr:GNAT family N-acetyltransferase [Rhizobiaceae bacterium]